MTNPLEKTVVQFGIIFLDTECQASQQAARGETDDVEREIKIREEESDNTLLVIVIIGIVLVLLIILVVVIILIYRAKSRNKGVESTKRRKD